MGPVLPLLVCAPAALGRGGGVCACCGRGKRPAGARRPGGGCTLLALASPHLYRPLLQAQTHLCTRQAQHLSFVMKAMRGALDTAVSLLPTTPSTQTPRQPLPTPQTCPHLCTLDAQGINFVHEDDAGRVDAGAAEEVAHTRRAHTHNRLGELGPRHLVERDTSLARNGLYRCSGWEGGEAGVAPAVKGPALRGQAACTVGAGQPAASTPKARVCARPPTPPVRAARPALL